MERKEWSFSIGLASRALLSLTPVGSMVTSIWNDAVGEMKFKRVEDFINSVAEEVNRLRDTVNEDYVARADFWDILEMTTKRIIDERSEAKRIAYKNILLKGVFELGISYDQTETQMKILDQIMEPHIELLRLLHKPREFAKNKELPFEIGGSLLNIFSQIIPGWPKEYLADHLADLENLRLIVQVTGSLQTMRAMPTIENLEGKLTARGLSFVKFILRE